MNKTDRQRRDVLLGTSMLAAATFICPSVLAQRLPGTMRRVPIQYIAALGEPGAMSGDNASEWGLWPLDPGPRGVRLAGYDTLQRNAGTAPAGWTFDNEDWWLEEHGLIMEAPEFPLPAGRYQVTGDREAVAILTVAPPDSEGRQHWYLDEGATIYDVTHLRCRSGRYTPAQGQGSCTPAAAHQRDFPVRPGADMPDVEGCQRQDYAVFIVTAIGEY